MEAPEGALRHSLWAIVHRLGKAKVTVTAPPLLCELLELHLPRTRGLAAHISVVHLYHRSPRQEKRPFSTSHVQDVKKKKTIKSGAVSDRASVCSRKRDSGQNVHLFA